uniref:Inorganic phosphate transporter n=1 Tax=Candidatus Methanomethylicus mesodigestus TaxID=1867258 RepID=A0A7C3J4C8_9CREN
MDLTLILLVLGLLFAFIMAMNLGGNDAANPTSAVVGTGIMTIKKALILFSVFTLAGACLQGFMVMKTIGRGIVPSIDVAGAFAIIIAANIWIFSATWRGMAISTTHSTICAVIGYGIVKYGIGGFNASVLGSIVVSWFASPFFSMVLAIILYKLISAYLERHKDANEKRDLFFKMLLIFSLALSAYSFGANDVANATGIYVTIGAQIGQFPDMNAMILLAIYGVAGIILGGFLFGPRVIETLAFKVTRLDLTTGLAASISNALVVYLFTTIPYLVWGYGLPISTSYAAVGAIIGASFARSARSVSRRTSLTLILYWVLTVPITIVLSSAIYYALEFII